LLFLWLFLYAILGVQLFAGSLGVGDNRPRQHFDTLWNAFLTCFQVCSELSLFFLFLVSFLDPFAVIVMVVLTSPRNQVITLEDWNSIMYRSMTASSLWALLFFISLVCTGSCTAVVTLSSVGVSF